MIFLSRLKPYIKNDIFVKLRSLVLGETRNNIVADPIAKRWTNERSLEIDLQIALNDRIAELRCQGVHHERIL
ncbi:MAG: hypothetical protein KME10_24625 [Plectolyngbya sp. WJT66-NPBG17]|jgi:hypothetical protein|nr:hypothetical protein [Plectolyngbya sp. WJT66-NPBG17]